MSKIGKKPIAVPGNVSVKIVAHTITIHGPKGELAWTFPSSLLLLHSESEIRVRVKSPKDKDERALWGLGRALVSNMITGVLLGYERKLEIQGIGYKAAMSPKGLSLEIGYSHSVDFPLPKGIECIVEKNIITLRGIDKQLVGEIAAQIRSLRPPEPYKGKGIRFVGELVRKKAGKAAKAAGSKPA